MKSSTTAIIVSYKSKWIIENCIKSIEQNARIIIVENSNDYKLKKFLEKKYKNLEVVINNNDEKYNKVKIFIQTVLTNNKNVDLKELIWALSCADSKSSVSQTILKSSIP